MAASWLFSSHSGGAGLSAFLLLNQLLSVDSISLFFSLFSGQNSIAVPLLFHSIAEQVFGTCSRLVIFTDRPLLPVALSTCYSPAIRWRHHACLFRIL
jgi:hypothetical protein